MPPAKGNLMKQRKGITLCTALLCIVSVGMAYGASSGAEVKIKGLITGRDGEDLTLKSSTGSVVVVVLTDDTKVGTPKGVLRIRHSEQSVTALIPGLRIEVQGMGTESRVVARYIKFEKSDLRLAEVIQAGLTPTQQQAAANKEDISTNAGNIASNKEQGAANQEQIATNQQDIQDTTKRFSELSQYDTKSKEEVYFATSSSTISGKDQEALTLMARSAVGLEGYIIQVKGYADSSGQAAMNQQLSMDRAQAVVAFLLQNCKIPLRHIVAPGAMGEADPAAPNEVADGRAENRRVEVKVLVNRGVAGANANSAALPK
jgi:outer membrane protein OmpA-like peptidoglycan-associated protein